MNQQIHPGPRGVNMRIHPAEPARRTAPAPPPAPTAAPSCPGWPLPAWPRGLARPPAASAGQRCSNRDPSHDSADPQTLFPRHQRGSAAAAHGRATTALTRRRCRRDTTLPPPRPQHQRQPHLPRPARPRAVVSRVWAEVGGRCKCGCQESDRLRVGVGPVTGPGPAQIFLPLKRVREALPAIYILSMLLGMIRGWDRL